MAEGFEFDFAWDEASMAALTHKLGDKRTRVGKMLQFTAHPVEGFISWFGGETARAVNQAAPKDLGGLSKSHEFRWTLSAGGQVISTKRYAGWVDQGTRPHWPPPGALAGWASRHGIPEFLVQRAIARHGTKPTYYMAEGLRRAAKQLSPGLRKLGVKIEQAWGD